MKAANGSLQALAARRKCSQHRSGGRTLGNKSVHPINSKTSPNPHRRRGHRNWNKGHRAFGGQARRGQRRWLLASMSSYGFTIAAIRCESQQLGYLVAVVIEQRHERRLAFFAVAFATSRHNEVRRQEFGRWRVLLEHPATIVATDGTVRHWNGGIQSRSPVNPKDVLGVRWAVVSSCLNTAPPKSGRNEKSRRGGTPEGFPPRRPTD